MPIGFRSLRRSGVHAEAIRPFHVRPTRRTLLTFVPALAFAALAPLLSGCGSVDCCDTGVPGPPLSRLLFTTSNATQNTVQPGIYSIAPDGTSETRLTNGASAETQARFNYNRTKIVYAAGSGVSRLVVANADGSNPVTIPAPPGVTNATFPAFRPDGQALVFVADGNKIYTENLDGSNPKPVLTSAAAPGQRNFSDPTYTPDGNHIVYAQQTGGADFGLTSNIGIISTDGTGQRVITSGQQPDVSPDGTQVAYTVNDSAGPHLRLIHLDGTGDKALGTGNTNEFSPAFSPDGSQIAFLRHPVGESLLPFALTLHTVNVDGTDEKQIGSQNVGGAMSLDWR